MSFHAASVFGAMAVLTIAIAPPPARAANPLDDLIKPEKNNSACFTRHYDAAHLRAHPKQKTASMTVWLKYEPTGGAGPDLVLSVALSIVQRGAPAALFSQGECNFDANRDTSNNRLIKTYPKESGHICLQSARPDVFEAISAEEGGDLILDRGKDRDTLMVYLDEGLTMVKRANRGDQLDIRFGADDRVFMLRRANTKDCAAVEEAVTTLEPGVAPRQR